MHKKVAKVDDVAAEADVSKATVSRVFNKTAKVSQATKEKVLQAAKKLNYHPNRVARRLKINSGQSLVIGLIIADMQNPFFSEIARGVEDIAYSNKSALMVCNSDEDFQKEQFYIDTLLSEQVSGLIISQTPENESRIQAIADQGVPIVAVDRQSNTQQIDTVVINNELGAYLAVKHLISLGHKRIGIINSLTDLSTTKERFSGYKRALKEAGIALKKELIKYGDSYESGGLEQTNKLVKLDNPPTALFVTNNLMTLGCLEAMYNKRLHVPEDLAIVGFDDMPWAVALNPPLTAVRQPGYELGITAADLLIKRLNDPDRSSSKIVLNPELIVRESCGAVKK